MLPVYKVEVVELTADEFGAFFEKPKQEPISCAKCLDFKRCFNCIRPLVKHGELLH
jgi:hypothetical protein